MTTPLDGKSKPSICLVAHAAYGALTGGARGFIGGVEWQTSLTARWLAARGYRVSMLTWDDGGQDGEVIDGVRALTICRSDAGCWGLRFFHPKWTGLVAALRRADADLYYHNCGECVTGQVALWCRRNGRKFVYSVASDPDCDPGLPELRTLRERVLYRYGLRRADLVIVQTQMQRDMLRNGFGRASTVIPMPCAGPSGLDFVPPVPRNQKHFRVLWVARICKVKRPDRLLELAQWCPEISFDVVGPISEDRYAQQVAELAKTVPNVVMHGPIPRDRVGKFYRQASCLCCTSDFEGFPNTFLEAWSHGLPIVSTFDPDRLIQTCNLGVVATDVPGLAAGIRKLMTSPDYHRQASANARRYYLGNHTVDAVLPRFEQVFLEALNDRPSRKAESRVSRRRV